MPLSFFEALRERARRIDSCICVGIDPRIDGAPDAASALTDFGRRLVETCEDLALCFKPNMAYFEAYGPPGLEALLGILERVPDDCPVILDAKRGDIGVTGEHYARALYEVYGADAVTIAPYLGRDAVAPFLEYEGKGLFVLCRTTNPSAPSFQELPVSDNSNTLLYERIAREAAGWSDRVGLVVAGNDTEALERVRAVAAHAWFLCPGIGAQGGRVEAAVASGLRADGLGLIASASRSIAGADSPREAARTLRDEFRAARDRALGEGTGGLAGDGRTLPGDGRTGEAPV